MVYEYVYDKDPKSIDEVLKWIEKYIEMKKRTDKSSGVIKVMDGGIAVLQDQDGNELSWGGSVADSVPGDVPQYDENGNYIYAMKGGKGGYGASFGNRKPKGGGKGQPRPPFSAWAMDGGKGVESLVGRFTGSEDAAALVNLLGKWMNRPRPVTGKAPPRRLKWHRSPNPC